MTVLFLRMTGRCANGAERDGGSLYHAVATTFPWQPAFCGAKPGPRGNGWSSTQGDAATCPRCLAKMQREAVAVA